MKMINVKGNKEMNKQFGLLGKTLSHSFSPMIHAAIMEVRKVQGEYHLLERHESDIEALFNQFIWEGINITIPYKVTVMPYCDVIMPEAKEIGAINTIQKKNGRFIGHNTDYTGIEATLNKQGVDINQQRVVILGSGGASQSAIVYAKNHGASEVIIVSRHPAYANDKYGQVINYEQLEAIGEGYLLINATPVGMYPKMDQSPVSEGIASRFEHVFDMIYNPSETQLLAQSKQTAKTVGNGLTMLIYQAIRAQEIWNKITITEMEREEIVRKITKEMANA
jgi:shikimate dehydrogenase